MGWLGRFYSNHVLANLAFVLVLVLGIQSYLQMPRERDPEINFNFVNIITVLPGASSEEVERRITDPLEEALAASVKDLDYVSSTSRVGVSVILVRFNQIDERTFEKRMVDLRREIQNTFNDTLPDEARDPIIFEATTSSTLPAAMVVVRSAGDDENLRAIARQIRTDLERVDGVDRVDPLGLPDPELHVSFLPERLEGLGVTPADLSDTVRDYFRDVSVGDLSTVDNQWIVRFSGTNADPSNLADYPIVTAQGVVPLGTLAELTKTTDEPDEVVRYQGDPAILLTVTKQAEVNVLDLIAEINEFIAERNRFSAQTGVDLNLIDDQTVSTQEALSLMQNNALIGLILVLFVTWMFLGTRIALLTSIGIPFTLAGTFIILKLLGMSVNNTVLLGIVIALGMLVDDAVVVVEAIYQRLRQGMTALNAATGALGEVFAPVTTSVLTTIAAFLPLTLLPGIVGQFMKVIPITVCVALGVSLLQAYWMLPTHISALNVGVSRDSKVQRMRIRVTHWLRLRYSQALLKALRYPWRSLLVVLFVLLLAFLAALSDRIRYDFFASDSLRLFYINAEFPKSYGVVDAADALREIETQALAAIDPDELRASVVFAGQQMTETEPLYGENIGQIMVSLNPQGADGRHVNAITDAVEEGLAGLDSKATFSMLRLQDGPPAAKAVSAKLRGNDYDELYEAASRLKAAVSKRPEYENMTLDYTEGKAELVMTLNGEAIKRAGLMPGQVTRSLQAYIDGEIVSQFQDRGEEVNVRVIAKNRDWDSIDVLLRQTISLPTGGSIAIGELVDVEYGYGLQNIKHYLFRRTITLESDINEDLIDAIAANRQIAQEWEKISEDYPTINIDFTGQFDEIQESLDSITLLMIMGLGLIYLILGTQFSSYFQPMLVLASVPLAITGVMFGLFVTGNPLSLWTLYGVVALMGISVNSAIVLISAANDRLEAGMSLLHATVYAARRRVLPVMITSLTTIAGLFSLSAGLAGESLIWRPVATAIVAGLAFATVLTLFVVPLLYRATMAGSHRVKVADE